MTKISGITTSDTTPATDNLIEMEKANGTSVKVTQGNMIAEKLRESSGPTTLAVGSVTDAYFLQRSGSSVIGAQITEANQVLADNTTLDVSTTKHGYVPKLPASTVLQTLYSDGVWRPRIIRKTSNQSLQNNTLTNDTDLKFTVAANEVWKFKLFLIVNAANATMDMKVGWTYPASATAYWGTQGTVGVSINGIFATGTASSPDAVAIESTVISLGTAAVRSIFIFEGVWTISSTAGTVQLQWAQATTNANNLTVETNSHLELQRLA